MEEIFGSELGLDSDFPGPVLTLRVWAIGCSKDLINSFLTHVDFVCLKFDSDFFLFLFCFFFYYFVFISSSLAFLYFFPSYNVKVCVHIRMIRRWNGWRRYLVSTTSFFSFLFPLRLTDAPDHTTCPPQLTTSDHILPNLAFAVVLLIMLSILKLLS